ncbi:MAG: glycoside hydrolase family 16 protein [Bacteroidales bacterium]|nr:glycoside hydrolase family 16 protein [Bacteroidales bacterium]MBS3775475.1 glycoside hydrolase family 16 protein [Bacteroidales bacterium]
MKNVFYRTRFRIFSFLGLVPDSGSFEKREKAIERDYNYLLEIQQSDELARFEELKNYFRSDEFRKKKKEINGQKYRNSEPYHKEKRFNKLRKSDPVKTYLKVADSKELNHYLRMKDSEPLKRYYELKEYFGSEQFEEFKRKLKHKRKQKKDEYKDALARYKKSKTDSDAEELRRISEELKGLKFENTEDFKKYQEYKRLKKDPDIKKAIQFRNSKKFAIYQSAVESESLKEYQDLKDHVESDDFIETKAYLKTPNKFKYSNLYQNFQEYKTLEKSDKIRWYYKHVNSEKFAFHKNYERTFLDKFEDGQIDGNKWLTSYYWGKALLNESYVQTTDAHFFTDGNNLKIHDGVLTIITREEEAEGKVWDPKFGFYPRKFSYTSGIINTGQSFRQKYGLFRAKVRLSYAPHLRHCFWMVSDKILPEVDVFHYTDESPRKMEFGSYKGNPKDPNDVKLRKTRIKGPNFSKRFYIFSLEWKHGRLIWRINGMPVNEFKFNIPEEPMYMILNSGLNGEVDSSRLPKEMQVEWVEAYIEK